MGTLAFIILGLIIGSFALRIVWGALRFIYGAAPFIVIWSGVIIGILYMSGDLHIITNELRKQNDATDITAVKD